jgi:hypothetical protein
MNHPPLFSAEEYQSAYRQAASELGMPPRGRRRSQENRIRAKLGSRVAQRARAILWLRRALGSTYGGNEG